MKYTQHFFKVSVIAASIAATSQSFATNIQSISEYKANGLLVKTKQSSQISLSTQSLNQLGFKIKRTLTTQQNNIALVSVPKGKDIKTAQHELSKLPDVEFVEPNYIYTTQATVNDPDFEQLWGLHNELDTDINAQQAWDISTGSEDVVIAVLDTGIDYNHPDLSANMWINPNEIADDGIDNDNNGYVDDIYGIDTAYADSDPMDIQSHGTHVAGTIAAVGNNELGVVGVAHQAKMIACKFLNDSGSGETANAIECLNYLADLKENHGVNLVATNNSWGGGGESQLLQEAIERHNQLGILFIAAAGNNGRNTDTYPHYPSSYDNNNIISVASLERDGQLSNFSNFGTTSVDIAAPGGNIYSTIPSEKYATKSGTSMAAPHVTGAAVLLASAKPELTMAEQRNLIISANRANENTSNKVASGGTLLTFGDNQDGILNCSDKIDIKLLKPNSNNGTVRLPFGEELVISVSSLNCGTVHDEFNKNVDIQGFDSISLKDDGLGNDVLAGDGIYTASFNADNNTNLAIDFTEPAIPDFNVERAYLPQLVDTRYQYTEIEGINIPLSDDSASTIPLPFEFIGSSGTYNKVTVSSNGIVFLGEQYFTDYVPETLPAKGNNYEFVAPYWRDLIPAAGTAKYQYAVLGTEPNRQFIAEYQDISHFGGEVSDDSLLTFQVILNEADNTIAVNYKDIDIDGSGTGGLTASVGYQDNAQAVQYSFLENSLTSNSSWKVYLNGAQPSGLEFTTLSVDGIFRTGYTLNFNVVASSTDNSQDMTIELDNGSGEWQVVENESFSETAGEPGEYNYRFRVTQGEKIEFASLGFSVLEFTSTERAIADNAISEIIANPDRYQLITTEEHSRLITEAELNSVELGRNEVINNPTDFDLLTNASHLELLAEAKIISAQEARDEVINNPTNYDLVSKANHLQGVFEAEQDMKEAIQTSPEEYGLFSLDKLTLVTKDYVSSLPKGTHLLGSSENIDDLNSILSDVELVWVYKDGQFYGWSSDETNRNKIINSGYKALENISAGQGFWVKK